MTQNNTDHILAIQGLYNNQAIISKPITKGFVHNVYIVQHENEKNVFRFSSLSCATRNANISSVLTKYGFNVPKVSVLKMGSEYCEVYPFINGITLKERACIEPVSNDTIKRICKQLIEISYELKNVPKYEIIDGYNENILWRARAVDTCFSIINGSAKQICHCDLNDGNILLDKNDDVCAILDLDAVNKGCFELSILKMARFMHTNQGVDLKDFYSLCPTRFGTKSFNPKKQMQAYLFMRKIYRLIRGKNHNNIQTLQNRQK